MPRRTWGVLALLVAPLAWAQDPPLVSAELLPPEVPNADARVQSTMLGAQWEIERCYFGRGKKTGRTPTLKVDVELSAEGQVRDAKVDPAGSTLVNEELHACAVRVVMGLVFPPGPPGWASWTFTLGTARQTNGAIRLDYRGGDVPPGFHLTTEPNWKMLAPALVVLGSGYVVTVVFGLLTQRPISAVPLVGPLLWVGEVWSNSGFFAPIGNFFAVVWGGLEFAAQMAGAVLTIVGLATPRRVLERDAGPSVSLAPGVPGSPLGASLVGRF